jgi:C4-dicarboxylate-specific signal transduction histidine kinase
LLNNLLTEEKKISRLAVELQQLARENSEDTRPCSVQEIIQPIETILKGQAKVEGIKLLINIASGLPPIPKNGQDIQLVILSLIQNARSRVVEKYPSGKHERKKIQMTAMLDQQADQCRILVTIQDQGVTWPSSQSNQNNVGLTPEPWLALHQCKLFLQKIGGDLTVETIPEQHNICTCVLPC